MVDKLSLSERLKSYSERVRGSNIVKINGRVSNIVGLIIESRGPLSPLGGLCEIETTGGSILSEVVGVRESIFRLMPLGEPRGVRPGSRVVLRKPISTIPVGDALLGRVIDAMGKPIDSLGPIRAKTEYPLYRETVNPLERRRIREPLDVGIRAINGLITIGKGQRIGIMAGSGVGKSTLMGMMARYTNADVNVIALIGERGREVREFIEKDLGEEGLKRSVVVAVTSDKSPVMRMRGAFAATAIAEYFRDRGKDVLLMMDSVTRFCMAQREIGLATGEPPTTRGYTPSVFSILPKLLERAGNFERGSITGIYTVLVEGDDMNEPVADATRSILDGHIVLSRELANRNHYPAIDVLRSVSRVMVDIVDKRHRELARKLLRTLSIYKDAEDLINIGAYVDGSNPDIDYAKSKIKEINAYLQQDIEERATLEESVKALEEIFKD